MMNNAGRACPRCGTLNDPIFQFCRTCKADLDGPAAPLPGPPPMNSLYAVQSTPYVSMDSAYAFNATPFLPDIANGAAKPGAPHGISPPAIAQHAMPPPAIAQHGIAQPAMPQSPVPQHGMAQPAMPQSSAPHGMAQAPPSPAMRRNPDMPMPRQPSQAMPAMPSAPPRTTFDASAPRPVKRMPTALRRLFIALTSLAAAALIAAGIFAVLGHAQAAQRVVIVVDAG